MHKDLSLIGKHITLFFLITCLIACSDVQNHPKPDILLNENQMVEVLTDLIVIDGLKRTNSKIYESYGLSAPEHIYNKYKIDSTTLNQNIEYYNLKFEENQRIYEQVSKNIQQKKNYFDSINKLKDSLTKAKKLVKKDSTTLKRDSVIKPTKNKISILKK